MEPSMQLLLFIAVFGALAFIFGRNGHRGVRTDAVYAKSTRYLSEEEPILFWMAVARAEVALPSTVPLRSRNRCGCASGPT